MSPSLPPAGLPVDTVLVPYAFCVDVPNVVPWKLDADIWFNPDSDHVLGLYIKWPLSVSIYCLLYPALLLAENVTWNEPLVLVSSMLILSACVAVPDVFWFPAVLTPGRSMSAVPLNDTPPIFLAVASWVAVPELPDILPVSYTHLTLPTILLV